MTVTVRYFARLREEAGLTQDTWQTSAATVGDLWAECVTRHGLALDRELVRPALADEFCGWRDPLADGVTVVFMPPVSGG